MKKSERQTIAKALLKAANALEAGVYTQVTQAVRKALKQVRGPKGGRKGTVLAIAKALAKDPTLMNAIVQDAKENGGKPSTELIRDWIGEPLIDWREDWEIGDYDSPYDGLTYDIAPLLAKAALKWTYTGESVKPPIDYSEAGIQLSNLDRLVSRLEKGRSYNEEKDLQEVKERVAKLAKAVGLEVR